MNDATAIGAADFGDNLEALVSYAHALEPERGIDFLFAGLERAAASAQTEVPGTWLQALQRLAKQGEIHPKVARRLVEWVVAGDLDDARRSLVSGLLGWPALAKADAVSMASWVVERAQASDASWVAHVLGSATLRNDPPSTPIRVPLAQWLIRRGSAHLRSAGGWGEALLVLETLVECGASSNELERATAVLLSNTASNLRHAGWSSKLVAALGAVLDRGARPNELRRWLRGLGPDAITTFSHALGAHRDIAGFEPLAREVSSALLEGRVHPDAEPAVWRLLLGLTCKEQAAVQVPFRVACSGLEALRDPNYDSMPAQARPGWVRFLYRQALRSLRRGIAPAELDRQKQKLTSFLSPKNLGEVRDAVVAHVGECEPAGSLARRILTPPVSVHTVRAALLALSPTPLVERAGVARASDAECLSMAEDLSRVLLGRAWSERLGGVDVNTLLEGIDRIAAVEKSVLDGRSVLVEGHELRCDRADLARVLGGEGYDRRLVAASWLVHELIHQRSQRLGPRSSVPRMRGTGVGGESNLLHVDLSADHAAALIAAEAFEIDVRWVKDQQGRSLAAFPASPRHSEPGWFRKALRLASLRADLLWGGAGRGAGMDEGYVFVDFGPTEGDLVVFESGPPFRVLAIAALSEEDATKLHRAVADEDATPLADVDAILRRIHEEATRTASTTNDDPARR